MIVMTGSSITTKFPSPGDRVRFAIDGLGEAALEVTCSWRAPGDRTFRARREPSGQRGDILQGLEVYPGNQEEVSPLSWRELGGRANSRTLATEIYRSLQSDIGVQDNLSSAAP